MESALNASQVISRRQWYTVEVDFSGRDADIIFEVFQELPLTERRNEYERGAWSSLCEMHPSQALELRLCDPKCDFTA